MQSERLTKLLTMEQANPDDAFIKFAIALEYVNAGKDELALPYFELLAGKHPHYQPLYYHLGKLYERTGALNEARKIYTAGFKIAQSSGDLKTAGELTEALSLLEDE